MNKEALIALGLTEAQADSVIEGYGQMIPKSRLDGKIQEVKDLTGQLTDRDKQLTELKKVDAKGLQDKITELETANSTAKTEYEQKLKDTQLSSALKLALAGKVHDADLVTTLIDKGTVELDDKGNVTKGLDEQLKTLQESKAFLFVEDSSNQPPGFKGVTPPDSKRGAGQGAEKSSYGEQLAKAAAENNKGLEEARQSYFQ